ncbi:MAG: phosphoribosylaminoimidazolesuccinocarboxamide synthase [Candidatus Levybacteria bacterium]|nr:phosphoribosylaminoimidazolesuccinocarboxamide synthase [Candidatus Levybacteria bacterium]
MTILKTVDLPGLGKKHQGKVRDFYILKDKRIIVTTDRQSAFDVNLGHIPHKGAVLNMLAAFWFEKTKDIIPNHLISVPDPNVTIARNAEMIPIEMIVRGYISGVTKTSIWYSYERGEREIYGIPFPEGLRKNQKLPHPVITPTTHGGGKGGHDERLTKDEILKRKIVSKKLYEQMEKTALALFERGTKICSKADLILVDTKYEFGLYKGKLMLVDEIHTPDSSRFWIKETYRERFLKGLEPENFDKEFLRLWYNRKGYTGDGKPLPMPKSLIAKVSKRYRDVYTMITGKKFAILKTDASIENRIVKNLIDYDIKHE